MQLSKKKILITGGNSRFCFFLKKYFNDKNIIYSEKKKIRYFRLFQFVKSFKI